MQKARFLITRLIYGTAGYCSACSKLIPGFEMVLRAKSNVYHPECFVCQMCNHRFKVYPQYELGAVASLVATPLGI